MAALPPQSRRVVTRVRRLVRKAVPGCNEAISYGIPAFSLERVFMYCAAFKSHIGIYPPLRGNTGLVRKLRPYANAKGNLRFALSAPVPYALINRLARALARAYSAKPKARPGKRVARRINTR